MTKAEFVKRTAKRLRANRARKPVTLPSHTFHISDDSGTTQDFTVRPSKGMVMYNAEDVKNIFDAVLDTLVEIISEGERLIIQDVGSIGVQYCKPQLKKMPGCDEPIEIPARYKPKVNFGNAIKRAARQYGINVKNAVENDKFVYDTTYQDYHEEFEPDDEDTDELLDVEEIDEGDDVTDGDAD